MREDDIVPDHQISNCLGELMSATGEASDSSASHARAPNILTGLLGVAGLAGAVIGLMQHADAQDMSYGAEPKRVMVCKATNAYQMEEDGSLGELKPAFKMRWPKFSVDRQTGEVLGDRISNHDAEVTLFNPGVAADGMSFRVMWTTAGPVGTRNVFTLAVNVWADGFEKPFMWSDMLFIYTGTCE
jgi:hypothetical protein